MIKITNLTEDDKLFCSSIFKMILAWYELVDQDKPLNPTLLIIKSNLEKAIVELEKEHPDLAVYNTALKAMNEFSKLVQIQQN